MMTTGFDARAQRVTCGQSVAKYERPDDQPIGARLGPFTVDPCIGGSEPFDHNILSTNDRTVGDENSQGINRPCRQSGDAVEPDKAGRRYRHFNHPFEESIENASPGYRRRLVSVEVDHELLRNVL